MCKTSVFTLYHHCMRFNLSPSSHCFSKLLALCCNKRIQSWDARQNGLHCLGNFRSQESGLRSFTGWKKHTPTQTLGKVIQTASISESWELKIAGLIGENMLKNLNETWFHQLENMRCGLRAPGKTCGVTMKYWGSCRYLATHSEIWNGLAAGPASPLHLQQTGITNVPPREQLCVETKPDWP